MSFKNKSLAFKSSVVFSLLLLLFYVLMAYLYFEHTVDVVEQEVISQVQLPGILMSRGEAKPESVREPILFQKILDCNIVSASYFEREGVILYSSDPELEGTSASKLVTSSNVSTGRTSIVDFRDEDSCYLISILTPVNRTKGASGQLFIQLDITDRIWRNIVMALDLGWVLLIAFILMALLQGVIVHYLLAPDKKGVDEEQVLEIYSVIDGISDTVVLFHPDASIRYINPAGRKLLFNEGQNIDQKRLKLSDIFPEWAYRKFVDHAIQVAIETGCWSGESAVLCAGGSEMPVSQVVVSHKAHDGSVEYVAAVMRDISEFKIAEKVVKDSEESLKLTLNSIGEAVIATDSNGGVVRMNPKAEELTGWKLKEAFGEKLETILNIIDSTTRKKVPSPVEDFAESGEITSEHNDTLLLTKDNRELIIDDNATSIMNSNGDIVGFVIVFRDITERYLLEEELRQSQKMDTIGQLAGGVAHDFNNMLTGIMGAAELMGMKLKDNPDLYKYIKIIEDASGSAADLTGKLLAFSRKGKILSTPVSMHTVIEQAVDILEHSIDRKIDIVCEFDAEYPVVIGDPSLLQNIIINLGINSRDSMPDGGTLRFKTSNIELASSFADGTDFVITDGEYFKVRVEDTGIGIEPEALKRIFEPFYTTKPVGEGTGLGLSAVYGSVQNHRGVIKVSSELNKGTCFDLYFPVNKTTYESNAHDVENASHEKVHDITVLIIDDEKIVRTMASDMLENLGYGVLLAEGGEEGLRIYKEMMDKIDLVFLDMIMPNMSGGEVFKEIIKINPDAKIVVTSGFTTDKSIADLIKDGAAGFLEKPYKSKMLAEVVGQVIDDKLHSEKK